MSNKPAHVSWFKWHVVWTVRDAREAILVSLLDFGVPAFMLIPIERAWSLLGAEEYGLKTQVHEDPAWVLQCWARSCRDWMDC